MPHQALQQAAAALLVAESSLSLSAAAAAKLNVRRLEIMDTGMAPKVRDAMNPIDYPADRVIAFRKALYYSDCDAMRRFRKEEPELFRKLRAGNDWVVCDAAKQASTSPGAMRVLIELGAPINEQDSNSFTGLCWAVTYGRYDVAKVLLECGADPNLDCPLFSVANSDKVKDRIAMAKLLLDHGANINQPFLVEDLPPRNVLSEAIAKRRVDLVEFLESRGAKLLDAPKRKN